MAESSLHTLDSGPPEAEQAIYRLRRRLIFYFQHNLSPEAEDLAQETIVRALGKVPPHLKGRDFSDNELIQFTFGVAGYVAMEGHRRRVFGARTEGLPVGADGDELIPSQKPNPLVILLAKERPGICSTLSAQIVRARRELLCVLVTWMRNTDHEVFAQTPWHWARWVENSRSPHYESVRECVRNRDQPNRKSEMFREVPS